MDEINKLIVERGSSEVMGKHLQFVKEQALALEKENAELKQENSNLKKSVAELAGKLSAKTVPDEFIKHRGALFKRKASGGYLLSVFCRNCREPMISLENELPYRCHPCNVTVDFTGHGYPNVVKELADL